MTTESKPLKYMGYAIVFQEVPNEVSLAINISGCPYHCENCHSKYLWEYQGEYVSEDFEDLIQQNINFITCVCFMGGDQNIKELQTLCIIAKGYDLKTCLYTGNNDIKTLSDLYPYLDYIKIGEYIEECGGLNQTSTNQKMYLIKNGIIDKEITSVFQK